MMDGSQLDMMDGLAFATDRDGSIQAVGENNWNVFAKENGASELRADQIVGQSIFRYIEGLQVQEQTRLILARISQDPNWCWVLPFRCDTPEKACEIRQYIRPVFEEHTCTGFLFHSIVHRSRPRPIVPLFDFKRLKRLTYQNSCLPIVMMCSWCQRVQSETPNKTSWVEAEDYYAAGGTSDVRLSHGICDDCLTSKAPYDFHNDM